MHWWLRYPALVAIGGLAAWFGRTWTSPEPAVPPRANRVTSPVAWPAPPADEPAARRAARELFRLRGGAETARWVEALPDVSRRWAAAGLIEFWGEADPLAALLWADCRLGDASVAHAVWNAASAQPAKLAAYLSIRPRDATTADRVRFVAEFWAWRELSAALVWMESLSEPADRRAAFKGLSATWVRRDAQGALTEALRTDDRQDESVLSAWAGRDLASARSWVFGQARANELRWQRWLFAVARGAFEATDDPARVIHLFEGQEFSAAEGHQILERMLQRWAGRDRLAAEAWVLRPSSPRLGWLGASLLASHDLQRMQPKSAAEWLDRYLREGPAFESAGSYEVTTVFPKVAAALAEQNPAQATAWVSALAAAAAPIPLDQTASAVTLRWLERDPRGALDWLRTLPAAIEPSVRAKFFEGLARSDGPLAAELTSRLPVELRLRERRTVWNAWQRSDPFSADAWWHEVEPGAPLPEMPWSSYN